MNEMANSPQKAAERDFEMVRRVGYDLGMQLGLLSKAPFLAKAVFNLPHTRALIDRLQVDRAMRRLCGWETATQIPDETVFSRAFAEFAKSEFPQRVHAALVQRTQGERLIGHILRDSTAIQAREKPQPKAAAPPAPPSRRSHHKTKKPKSPEQMTRLDRQCSGTMTVEQMLSELPRACDVGCKTNSKGSKHFWIGYKLHLDVADGQIPVSNGTLNTNLNADMVDGLHASALGNNQNLVH